MDNRHEFGDCWTLNSVLLRRDEVELKTGVVPTTREKWDTCSLGFHPAPALVCFGELQPSLNQQTPSTITVHQHDFTTNLEDALLNVTVAASWLLRARIL
jgi:hypothetical protein